MKDTKVSVWQIWLVSCGRLNELSAFKHGAILYNEAEVFSLSITNPNGRPMLPFDWLIQSSLILAHCHKMFSCFLRLKNKFEN